MCEKSSTAMQVFTKKPPDSSEGRGQFMCDNQANFMAVNSLAKRSTPSSPARKGRRYLHTQRGSWPYRSRTQYPHPRTHFQQKYSPASLLLRFRESPLWSPRRFFLPRCTRTQAEYPRCRQNIRIRISL